MKMNANPSQLAQFLRQGLLLVAVLALLSSVATATRAQSVAQEIPKGDVKIAGNPVVGPQDPTAIAKPTVANAKGEPSAPEKSTAKGPQESLKVHGHWTIEVINLDGSVARHLEFENGLCPTQTVPVNVNGTPSSSVYPGGALALSLLATGQASLGPWMIFTDAAPNTTPGVPPGCSKANGDTIDGNYGSTTLIESIGFYADLSNASGNTAFYICGNSCVLMSPPSAPTASNPTITLAGQIPPSQSTLTNGGTIATVSTGNILCAPGFSQVDCAGIFPSPNRPLNSAILTGTQLPLPYITYTAGQAVNIQVVLSFSST
jgi:hypothetical protein